jgi:16S rRNA (guanine527-N7)-methyltransferase
MELEKASSPSQDAIRRALGDFGLSVDDLQVLQIQQYMGLLQSWNDKVNLTAIRDPLDILHRHFGESMFGAALLPKGACRLADVGSGGGFPGLPLKIIRPELYVFLIESSVKKATFLAEVVRELGLTETRVLVSRFEELGEEVAPLDVVCTRALGNHAQLLEWAGSAAIGAREVLLWTGGRDLEDVQKGSTWKWDAPVAVPHSLRRFLLSGKKTN